MLDLTDFLAEPKTTATFIESLKAGKVSMNWKEILADEEKLANLHELTFGLMMQAADNAESLKTEKLAPVLGKIFILNRQIETAALNEEAATLSTLCKQFEAALREFATLINVDEAVESIHKLQKTSGTELDAADLYTECPLFTVVFGLQMLVHADEVPTFEDEEEDEEMCEIECEDDCSDDNDECC